MGPGEKDLGGNGKISGYGLALRGSGDGTELGEAENENGMHAKGGHPVFEGGVDFRGIKPACISANKEIAYAHVENQFSRGTRIRAGQDTDGGGLTECSGFRDGASLPSVGDRFAGRKAIVSCLEGFLGSLHFNFRPGVGCSEEKREAEGVYFVHLGILFESSLDYKRTGREGLFCQDMDMGRKLQCL